MQSKLITAAAVVAGTKALNHEQTNTELVQVDGPGHQGPGHHHDHGYSGYGHNDPCADHRYGYDCLHQTVEEVLGELKDDVKDHKQECQIKADDLREDIVD